MVAGDADAGGGEVEVEAGVEDVAAGPCPIMFPHSSPLPPDAAPFVPNGSLQHLNWLKKLFCTSGTAMELLFLQK